MDGSKRGKTKRHVSPNRDDDLERFRLCDDTHSSTEGAEQNSTLRENAAITGLMKMFKLS